MVTSFEYKLAFDDIDFDWGDYICIATHAVVNKVENGVVTQQQTGWAGDQDFPGKNWALYFCYRPSPVKKLIIPTDPVYFNGKSPGPESYWQVHMSGTALTGTDVPASPSSGTTNQKYNYAGWCLESHQYIYPNTDYEVTLIPSYADDLGEYSDVDWDKINYILNHKQDYFEDGYVIDDIQMAIWHLAGDLYYDTPAEITRAGAVAILADADAKGAGYVPGLNGWVAIICDYNESGGLKQDCFIEIDP